MVESYSARLATGLNADLTNGRYRSDVQDYFVDAQLPSCLQVARCQGTAVTVQPAVEDQAAEIVSRLGLEGF